MDQLGGQLFTQAPLQTGPGGPCWRATYAPGSVAAVLMGSEHLTAVAGHLSTELPRHARVGGGRCRHICLCRFL